VVALQRRLEERLPGLLVQAAPGSRLDQRRPAGRCARRRPAPAAAGGRAPDGRPRPLGAALAVGPGDSLTFSLSLPYAPASWSGLSLAVGLVVAEALDDAGQGARRTAGASP
jgi:BirA family biotin operon repressor/biotin-[acetyl-CoA-carboxylase] ligase